MTPDTTAFHQGVRRREPMGVAYFWLLVFFIVYCGRPEDWIPLFGLPIAKIVGILALASFVFSAGQVRWRLPQEMIYLFLLIAQFWLAVPFAIWRGGAFQVILGFSKVALIMLVMALAVSTLVRLRRLIFVHASCVAIVSVVSVIKDRYVLGRLQGLGAAVYSNPNELAFAIALTLPMCMAFALRTHRRLCKLVWAFAMTMMAYALFLTGSRGGLITFVIALGVGMWEFGVRGRRHYLVVLAGFLGVCLLLIAGRGTRERFEAIFSPDLGSRAQRTANASSEARWELLKRSVVVTAEHPLFGIGPGNFAIVSGSWRETHNTFTQVSSEGGVAACVLFIMIFWRGFENLRRVKRVVQGQTEQMLLAGGLQASLAAFVAGAFFDSVAFAFFPFFIVGYTTALVRAQKPVMLCSLDTSGQDRSQV